MLSTVYWTSWLTNVLFLQLQTLMAANLRTVVVFCLGRNQIANILDSNINGFSPAITSPNCYRGREDRSFLVAASSANIVGVFFIISTSEFFNSKEDTWDRCICFVATLSVPSSSLVESRLHFLAFKGLVQSYLHALWAGTGNVTLERHWSSPSASSALIVSTVSFLLSVRALWSSVIGLLQMSQISWVAEWLPIVVYVRARHLSGNQTVDWTRFFLNNAAITRAYN